MKDIPLSGIISIVFGVIVLLVPQLLNYLIGLYLIMIGLLSIKKPS